MNNDRCLQVALRISARLQEELDEGIDAQRMLTEALYQRDVLLVCDALTGTEAQSLAGSFRRAFALQMSKPAEPARPALRAPLRIASLLYAIFGPAEPVAREKPAEPLTPVQRQPGAAIRRPQPPGRPRRTAVRPPRRRAAR